jgi:predicted nucleic-acid-binding Zn-ribbon protein
MHNIAERTISVTYTVTDAVLRPFADTATCPKCGWGVVRKEYVPADQSEGIGAEYLAMQCAECGYRFRMHCKPSELKLSSSPRPSLTLKGSPIHASD